MDADAQVTDVETAVRIIHAINEHRLDEVLDLLHPDWFAEWPEGELGPEAAFQREVMMFTAFPDTRFEIDCASAISDGRVLVEATVVATHTGPLRLPYGPEVQATGARVRQPFIFVMAFEDGKVRSERILFDQLRLLHQIGAVPSA